MVYSKRGIERRGAEGKERAERKSEKARDKM